MTPPIPSNLTSAAARINSELTRSNPMSLSAAARARLGNVHAEFLGDVGEQAIKIARRAGLATVDESHIDAAYAHISSTRGGGPSAVTTIANSLGGILSGAAIASGYAIVFTPGPHGTPEILTALILAVLGFVLLTVGLTLSITGKRN